MLLKCVSSSISGGAEHSTDYDDEEWSAQAEGRDSPEKMRSAIYRGKGYECTTPYVYE